MAGKSCDLLLVMSSCIIREIYEANGGFDEHVLLVFMRMLCYLWVSM